MVCIVLLVTLLAGCRTEHRTAVSSSTSPRDTSTSVMRPTPSLPSLDAPYVRPTPLTFPGATRDGPPVLPHYPQTEGAPTVMEQMRGGEREIVTEFTTTDTMTEVLAFYGQRLGVQAWKDPISTGDRLNLQNTDACPYYSLELRTTITVTATHVIIYQTPGACIQLP